MNCDNCGNPKRLVPAGTSKKTGKPYNAFEVCDFCKEQKEKSPNKDQLLMDEIQGLHKRFDVFDERFNKMAKFLVEEFKKLNEK